MYKLEWVNPKTIHDFAIKFGGYNDYPPNWKQVTEKELFTSARLMVSPDYQEYRQMVRKDGNNAKFIDATLYFLRDGTGYAVEKDFFNRHFNYYTFAVCEHEYQKTVKKMHEITYTCTKCGRTMVYDTSDCHSYS